MLVQISYEFPNWKVITVQRGDPMELNFEGLEILKSNRPTDRAERINEKNRVICPVLMFATGVMTIKMSKVAPFFYFLLMTAKN